MIPREAKLVFKGVLFDVYQWEQEMFDGSFQTFERLQRKPSVNILPITEDGKIMLLEEEQPTRPKFICLPGGQVEATESMDVAAKRELLEETGYEGSMELWMETNPYGNKIDWTVNSYVARNCKKVAEQRLDAGEKISLFFVDIEKFIDIAISDATFQNVEVTLVVMQAMRKPRGLDELKKFLLG